MKSMKAIKMILRNPTYRNFAEKCIVGGGGGLVVTLSEAQSTTEIDIHARSLVSK